MSTILTVGVYDLMHIGHINLFKNAKKLGDKLIVAVQTSEFVTKFKPSAKLFYTTDERIFMVGSIKYVDEVITYNCVNEIVKIVNFDVLAVGPDQTHKGFQQAICWCKEHGKEVIIIPRTEGVSSTMLRKD